MVSQRLVMGKLTRCLIGPDWPANTNAILMESGESESTLTANGENRRVLAAGRKALHNMPTRGSRETLHKNSS